MDILLVTSGCLFQDLQLYDQDLQLYDHIWLYDTIFYFHPRQRHINDCLSLYNAFPIFFRRLTTPTRFVRPWISMNFYPWLFQNLSKLWQTLVNGWLNKPEDFRGICVFLSEFDHLTMEGFPLSILQWIPLTKPRLYNHHYCHVYSPKHGTHIVVAISLNAKNHQTLTDHTRLRFHVKFPECASINHPK